MPRHVEWTHRLPEILEILEANDTKVLDRVQFGSLFRVRVAHAIRLMRRFGAVKVAGRYLLPVSELVGQLRAIAAGLDYQIEQERRQKIHDHLNEVRKILRGRGKTVIRHDEAVQTGFYDKMMDDLPGSITLKPGLLQIEFFGAEDLLRNLAELGQAILNDPHRFERMVGDG